MNNIYREKLLQAILFFAKSVHYPSKVKIFKLLFFLDFEHFNETGKSVTNLKYYAFPFGPVPGDLHDEIEELKVPGDFQKYVAIIPTPTSKEKTAYLFKAKSKPDLKVFTPREQKIMKKLAEIYKEATPSDMSEITHLGNSPWKRTLDEKGRYAEINYLLALDDKAKISREEAIQNLDEHEEMLVNFPIKKTLAR